MGSSNRQKKSGGLSLFNMFKSRRPRKIEDAGDDYTGSGRRVFRSDEDKGSWFADPGIDRRASEFITNVYAIRFSESELHAVYQPRSGNACSQNI